MNLRTIFLLAVLVNLATFVSFVLPQDSAETTTEEAAAEESQDETTEAAADEPETEQQDETTTEPSDVEESSSTTLVEGKTTRSSKTIQKCHPWPSTLRPLHECCLLPSNPLTITLNTCFYRCSSNQMPERQQLECGASCFVNSTGIDTKNRFYKERIKSFMIGGSAVSMKWIRVVEQAIDTCSLEERSSLHDKLARFFACVNDFMAENCVQFIQSRECEGTQELFEQCHHIKPICDHWPFGYGTLENCCKIPTLFSQELRSKCRRECIYSELFLQRQAKCDETCRYDDTKLRNGNRFDFEVIRAMLMQSAKNDKSWKKAIGNAVDKCRSVLGPERKLGTNSIEYEITSLQTCLREFLASDCAEFRDESICRKVKIFMVNCPDARPRKSTHGQQYGQQQQQYAPQYAQHGRKK